MNILFDLYQQGQISQASNQAERAASTAEKAQAELAELHRRVDALTLACQAMWEYVREGTGLKDEDLLQRMQEIDLRDGRQDGKISTTVMNCPKCGRAGNSTRKKCLYCGAAFPSPHVFDKTG